MTSSHHGSVWNVLGRCRFTWRMGAVALLTLALMGGVAVTPADAAPVYLRDQVTRAS